MKESIEQVTGIVALTSTEIEHILLALSCFDSEVDEHFNVTAKLQSALGRVNFMTFEKMVKKELEKDQDLSLSSEAIKEIYEYLIETGGIVEYKFRVDLQDVVYNFKEEHFTEIANNIDLDVSNLAYDEAFDLVCDELDKMYPVVYGSQFSGLIVYEDRY